MMQMMQMMMFCGRADPGKYCCFSSNRGYCWKFSAFQTSISHEYDFIVNSKNGIMLWLPLQHCSTSRVILKELLLNQNHAFIYYFCLKYSKIFKICFFFVKKLLVEGFGKRWQKEGCRSKHIIQIQFFYFDYLLQGLLLLERKVRMPLCGKNKWTKVFLKTCYLLTAKNGNPRYILRPSTDQCIELRNFDHNWIMIVKSNSVFIEQQHLFIHFSVKRVFVFRQSIFVFA